MANVKTNPKNEAFSSEPKLKESFSDLSFKKDGFRKESLFHLKGVNVNVNVSVS